MNAITPAECEGKGEQAIGVAQDAADFKLLSLRVTIHCVILFAHGDTPSVLKRSVAKIITDAL
jgi:hypothetical protein